MPGNPAYNVLMSTRIRMALDVAAFRRSLNLMVRRQPVLRTCVALRNGEPVQRVKGSLEIDCPLHEASGCDDSEFRERLLREAYLPFRLEDGPLVRASLYRRAACDYVLNFVVHHIVTDLWSAALIARELDAFYAAGNEASAELVPLRASYSDFVREQAEMLAGPKGAAHWEFWQREIDGDLPPLAMPLDYPRLDVPSLNGASEEMFADRDVCAVLKGVAMRSRSTLCDVCLACFEVLLHYYSGQEEFGIGFPRACRSRKYAAVQGYFVNPVVLKAHLQGDPSFAELLSRVTQRKAASLAHGEFPFPLLVERLRAGTDRSRSPLFQAAFTWDKTTRSVNPEIACFLSGRAGGELGTRQLPFESLQLENRAAQFEIGLQMGELGTVQDCTGLTGAFTYATDLFTRATMQRVARHYERLLQAAAAHPELKISRLASLSQERHGPSVMGWAAAPEPPRESVQVHDRFTTQAQARPAALAVLAGSERCTYSELEDRANRIAAGLRAAGVDPEDLVGLSLERSVDLIAAFLGVLKAGGAFVPLDPWGPPERLRFMVQDAGIRVILTRQRYQDRLACPGVQSLDIEDQSAWSPGLFEPQRSGSHPEQQAYVIYTSGSTGTPKGVSISVGSFEQHCRTVQEHYALTSQDRVLQFASPNFDAALEQIFPILVTGGTLVLRDGEIWSPRELHRNVVDLGLSVVNLPPAYWLQWLDEWSRMDDRSAPPRLRLVIVGGDTLPSDGLRSWNAVAPPSIRLLNAYGPTETTITATTYEFRSGWPLTGERTPIGKPLAHRMACVLDKAGDPVPEGVSGQLYLGGGGLARGYLNRPDLTAERFLPNPFSSQPGARLYRTGDLALVRTDGNIEYLGRSDQQVKLRGFRIELEEIESVLRQCPGVKQAGAALRARESGEQFLCAYLATSGDFSLGRLRSLCRSRLPAYMIPGAVVRMESLPLTSGGKIDRQSLPDPGPAAQDTKREFTPPRSDLEASLAAIWAELLGTQVGVRDNFFELGGHSLLATQVVSRLRDSFGFEVPLQMFFADPTVEGLAVAVAQCLLEQSSPAEGDRLLEELDGSGDLEARASRAA